MKRPVWTGLAVFNDAGVLVCWRGSETPKLYRSEEQGSVARTDGCTFEPVIIVRGTLAELMNERPIRHAHTPEQDYVAPKAIYQVKRCARCAREFQPRGPRALYCREADCRAAA